MRILISFVTLLFPLLSQANPALFQDGDLIFQKSASSQAAALEEATESPWTHVGILFRNGKDWVVAEGSEPVRIIGLNQFVRKGKNKEYRVYRHQALESGKGLEQQVDALKLVISPMLGLPYDIYFEWADDRIYCSELVFKSFQEALGIEVGRMQKFRDLRLDGPHVRKLIKDRLESIGKPLNLDEPVITPIAQMEDPALRLIFKSHK
jgi:hypothetical protein